MDKVLLRMGFLMFSGGYDQTVKLCNTGNTAWTVENPQLFENSSLSELVCCQIAFGETHGNRRYSIKKAPEFCQDLKITSKSRLSVSKYILYSHYILQRYIL